MSVDFQFPADFYPGQTELVSAAQNAHRFAVMQRSDATDYYVDTIDTSEAYLRTLSKEEVTQTIVSLLRKSATPSGGAARVAVAPYLMHVSPFSGEHIADRSG